MTAILDRRSLLSAGASLAVSGAVAAPIGSSQIAAAIERHKQLRVVIEEAGSTEDETRFAELCDEEFRVIETIARAPCATDAEVFQKLKYLFDFECKLFGGVAGMADHNGSVMIALFTTFYGDAA